ncbi:MAG: transporter substrate-binding domain-containing protein [Oscillospiraceae bacterium]|nr:transporter substrate-binding domain-containing protein [Oscillospiraceae bacterium]
MKKIFALIIASLMLVAMTACSSSSSESTSTYANRLEEIKARGYITVATEPYFAPQEFIDPTITDGDNIVGSDIEFAKWLADKLGVELRIVPLEFSEVLASVQQGKYDLAISALAYKEDRAESMNLSKPYYKSGDSKGYGMIVRAEDKENYKTAESFADATIIVQKASLQEGFVNNQIPRYKELKYLSSMNDTFYAVSEGKADAAACAIDMAELFIEQNPNLGLAIADEFKFTIDEDKEGVLVAMKKGEDELTEEINKLIDEFTRTGLYKQWNDEYKDYAKKLGIMN